MPAPPLGVRVFSRSRHPLPAPATEHAAGMDLRALLDAPLQLAPGERALVPTGLHLEIPPGYEGQVRPRSGLAYREGLTALNSPGTLDADYRGEVKVLLINHGREAVRIEDGQRIAQLLITPVMAVRWDPVARESELAPSARGEGGFGHSGR